MSKVLTRAQVEDAVKRADDWGVEPGYNRNDVNNLADSHETLRLALEIYAGALLQIDTHCLSCNKHDYGTRCDCHVKTAREAHAKVKALIEPDIFDK